MPLEKLPEALLSLAAQLFCGSAQLSSVQPVLHLRATAATAAVEAAASLRQFPFPTHILSPALELSHLALPEISMHSLQYTGLHVSKQKFSCTFICLVEFNVSLYYMLQFLYDSR